MIKTILVAASGTDNDAAAYAAALAVARPFAAHLDALHVKLDAVNTAVAMTADAGTGALTAGLIDRLEQDAREREKKAHDLFAKFCSEAKLALRATPSRQRTGVSAEWHVEAGEEPRWMAQYGTTADLIVTRRGTGDDVMARSTLEAVLLESGRPILIPAAAPIAAAFERVAIAWKPTAQAARAVTFAMPFLEKAKEIVVVTVEEDAEGRADSDRLRQNLAWHGLKATALQLKPGPEGAAATLLPGIAGRTDLLVMGGYGHSRLREWVFGGFTQLVLADAPLPVLLAH